MSGIGILAHKGRNDLSYSVREYTKPLCVKFFKEKSDKELDRSLSLGDLRPLFQANQDQNDYNQSLLGRMGHRGDLSFR